MVVKHVLPRLRFATGVVRTLADQLKTLFRVEQFPMILNPTGLLPY
jgi:hypothetical protein